MADYALMAVCVALAAFYSGSETGFYCMNRLRLRLRAERGESAARTLQGLAARPRAAVSTMLVGTNVGLYLVTVLFTYRLRGAGLAENADLYSSLILPPILLILAEIIPKSLFHQRADALMHRAAWPLRLSEVVFYPFCAFLRGVSAALDAALGRRRQAGGHRLTQEALRYYLAEGTSGGALSPFQKAMAENILRLKSTPLERVMTPLEQVAMVPEGASYEELLEALHAHRYSRMPIYRGSREQVVGVVHIIDVVCSGAERPGVSELSRPVLSLRPETSVAEALWRLRQARQPLGIVVREGRALGLATLKDLAEEIVGELAAW